MSFQLATFLLIISCAAARNEYYPPGVPEPRCPPLPPDTVGICVDLCTSFSCPGNQLCCSNGCGRVCKNPYYEGCPDGLPLACKAPACSVTTCPRQIEAQCRPTCFGCIPHFFDKFDNEVTDQCNCQGGEKPVKCFSNPCRRAKCPEHPEAVCRTNTCGKCEAVFYDRSGNEVECKPVCEQRKDPGPCEALIPRYYYNTHNKRCEKFTYGGCRGNDNNFKTLKQCQQKCGHDVCKQPKVVGPCEALIPRYFYNTATKRCEKFIYGGCQGNDNNFESLSECLQECGGIQYDPKCPKVPRDQVGICVVGCSSNTNCKPGQICCSNGCGSTCRYLPVVDVCKQPKVVGPCEAAIRRYFYNSASKKCEMFYYGGCEGNDNNFKSLKKCEQRCGGNVCQQPKVIGPCDGAFERYFYNTATKRCEKFIYGGCQGNDNNFKSLNECRRKCGGIQFDKKCPKVKKDQAGTCDVECYSNGDCKREGQICCSNGCGSTCTYPPLDKRCPPPDPEIIRTLPFRICPQPSCFSNDVCRKGDICCSNGCQQNCISSPFTDPRCPKVTDRRGNRRERCKSNLDCRGRKICCSNGRGTECKEIPQVPAYDDRCPLATAPLSSISCPKICERNSDCRSDYMCCGLYCGSQCYRKPRTCEPGEAMFKCRNVCEGLVCNKYPGAKCRVHGCGGCKAEFYDDQNRILKDCDDVPLPVYT